MMEFDTANFQLQRFRAFDIWFLVYAHLIQEMRFVTRDMWIQFEFECI